MRHNDSHVRMIVEVAIAVQRANPTARGILRSFGQAERICAARTSVDSAGQVDCYLKRWADHTAIRVRLLHVSIRGRACATSESAGDENDHTAGRDAVCA